MGLGRFGGSIVNPSLRLYLAVGGLRSGTGTPACPLVPHTGQCGNDSMNRSHSLSQPKLEILGHDNNVGSHSNLKNVKGSASCPKLFGSACRSGRIAKAASEKEYQSLTPHSLIVF